MRTPREFVFSCEHMGGTTWTVEHQWAIEGETEEIVRCRDCRHYVPEYGYSEERGFGQIEYMMEPPACARSKAIQITVDPNGFCAWGERSES